MSLTRERPRLVTPRVVVQRPVTLEDAARVHPLSYWNQQRWLRAVKYLRERSKNGWIVDKHVQRKSP